MKNLVVTINGLVVTINGRKALPVRALCLLAGRKRLSPDVVAGAACGEDHYDGDRHLPTCQLVDGVVHAVDPTHWVLFCEAIESASLLLRGKGPSLRATRTQWFNEATMLLPGGVFVWLDEFQDWFRRTRPYRVKEGKTGLQLEQPEEGRVSLAPPISDELRACLLAGFSPTPALPTAPTPEQPARDDAGPVPEDAYHAEAGVSTDGLVMWQAVMLEHWPMIEKAYGGKPTARKAMQWLKRHGSRGVFPEQQPDHGALAWLDLAGNPQTVSLKTIQNQIALWKAAGKIPA